MINQRLKNAIIMVVTMVWAANFGAPLFMSDYESDQTINAIFMAIVGGLFALGHRDENKKPPNGGGKS